VLANSRKLLSAGLAKQNSEAVIRGYKGGTLYASPGGGALEGLEGVAVVDFALGGAGAGAGGGGGYWWRCRRWSWICCLVCSLCVVRSCPLTALFINALFQ